LFDRIEILKVTDLKTIVGVMATIKFDVRRRVCNQLYHSVKNKLLLLFKWCRSEPFNFLQPLSINFTNDWYVLIWKPRQ